MTYIAGFLTPVPDENREAYIESARKAWPLFRDYGALSTTECWGDDIPDGTQTDFKRAVALKDGESVCFSWIVWPDKESHDRCGASMETDPRWQELSMPFDGKRMIWGGFNTVFQASTKSDE
ncbi:RNA signal recognition particle [Sulfitobacter sp. HI0082]|nr:RNA signal recognition particle [Sulfitobacter sp. HI0082]